METGVLSMCSKFSKDQLLQLCTGLLSGLRRKHRWSRTAGRLFTAWHTCRGRRWRLKSRDALLSCGPQAGPCLPRRPGAFPNLPVGAVGAHRDPEEKAPNLCVSLCLVLLKDSGGDTSSWSELNSQGVYHGLSAKKMGSCLPEGTRQQAGRPALGSADRCKAQPPCKPHAFVCVLAPTLFSLLLDKAGCLCVPNWPHMRKPALPAFGRFSTS